MYVIAKFLNLHNQEEKKRVGEHFICSPNDVN